MSSNNFLFIYLFIFSFTYIKVSKNLSAKYYQNNEERLQKLAGERYQSLSKEEKEKNWQYGCGRYENLLDDGK